MDLKIITGKNKAQISGQVFIYILAVVMIGLLFFIGIKAIGSILNTFQNTNIDSLKSDFQSDVGTVARQYGSVKQSEINLPSKFDEICFVDAMDEEEGKFLFDISKIKNNLIRDSVLSGAKENVFLMKKGVWQDKFTADKLDVQADYLCLKNEGKLAVWLRGTGKKALLFTQDE
jgi:hypothetical protein